MAVAADIDQKPPIAMPINARPTMKVVKSGANAASVADSIMVTVSASSSRLRSTPPARGAMIRLVTSAKAPETAMA